MCCWLTWLPKSIIYLIGELISPECVTTLAPPVTETSTTSANTPRSEQLTSFPISFAKTFLTLVLGCPITVLGLQIDNVSDPDPDSIRPVDPYPDTGGKKGPTKIEIYYEVS